MLKAAWLRNWLYHGQHLWYGVQNLSSDLRTSPAIAYSHELTGSTDAGVLLAMCIAFPVIAFTVTAFAALGRSATPRRAGATRGEVAAARQPLRRWISPVAAS